MSKLRARWFLFVTVTCSAALGACASDGTGNVAPNADAAPVDAAGGASDTGVTPGPDAAAADTTVAPADTGVTVDLAPPADGAPTSDGAATCDFSMGYSYGFIGGNAIYTNRATLAPGNKYTYTRTPLRGEGPTLSCSPALPLCGSEDVITAYDIEMHDLPQADVQAALAELPHPLFGYDSRPVDGTVFEFVQANGRGFLVGSDCAGHAGCRPIPAGVLRMTKRLQDLDTQQLGTPACAALR